MGVPERVRPLMAADHDASGLCRAALLTTARLGLVLLALGMVPGPILLRNRAVALGVGCLTLGVRLCTRGIDCAATASSELRLLGSRHTSSVPGATPEGTATPVVTAATRPGQRQPCVYHMRMGRVNVYMPAELVEEARAAGLNVSSVAQQALRRELSRHRAGVWLERVKRLPRTTVAHDEALAAVDAARAELGS